MRIKSNIQMALASIGAAKWRSFLTMLGVIIGVMSVVTIVSLGEGVKQQLTRQINHTGKDLITVRGGHVANRDSHGRIVDVNILNLFAGNNLSEADYQAVQKTKNLSMVAPFAVVTGVPQINGQTPGGNNISIIATNEKAALALKQNVLYGAFFEAKDNKTAVAVVGKRVAENLFKENVPLGRSFELRGKKVVVSGVFSEFEASPLTPGVDYNNAIFIPYDFGKELVGGPLQPYQILVRPSDGTSPEQVASDLSVQLQNAHGGQVDFSVLQAADSIELANGILTVLTNLVSAVAAISLVVGGIGIMNIMLVAVSERTHEIGIRKSVGATNRQILNQFITEAIMLSGTGGILGVLLSLLANYLLRVFTNLQPVITLPIMGVAVGVALVVGVVFGVTPALKAARKDPIDALRRI
jgi:ABC-type antimicrobial peptide transport system permease subunit